MILNIMRIAIYVTTIFIATAIMRFPFEADIVINDTTLPLLIKILMFIPVGVLLAYYGIVNIFKVLIGEEKNDG